MKRWLLSILALGFLFGLAFPLQGASDNPKSGGTLTMAIKRRMNLMNPMVSTRSTEKMIRDLMFEPLLGMDLEGNIQPNLAMSWEVSSDGKLYTFQLRKGVKFHDGREMSASDVKFSMDYTMNPKNGAYGLRDLKAVRMVEAPDKYTLVVHLKGVSAPFLASLTSIRAFSVIPKESLQEGVRNPTGFPPGTGPFKFVEWKPQQRIVFERFNDYWGHKAFIDKLVIRPILDATVRFTALRAGDVNMIEISPYEWVKRVLDGKVKGIKAVRASHASFRRVTFNAASPPFDNKKLREAVAHAINRQEILAAAYLGFGEATSQRYPKGHLWYGEGVLPRSYDVKQAKALVKASGYKGETLNLMVSAGIYNEAVAVAVQSQLRKIGLKVRLQLVERGSGLTMRRTGTFHFRTGGGRINPDPFTALVSFACEPNLKKRIRNESGYCNKEVDTLIKELATELDRDKRKWIVKQILTQLNKDVPSVAIGFAPEFFTMREYVKGFQTDSNGSFRWWGGGLHHVWLDK